MSHKPKEDQPHWQWSATAQAGAIASDNLLSADLLAAQHQVIVDRNPQLNAFIELTEPVDHVRQGQQETPRSALSGVSFAVKDNIDVLGTKTQCGLKALVREPAIASAPVVKRLQAAGLVLTGRLNMAPMAMGASTHNPDFGDCYNPLKDGYSAGGSSGGAASAVAAGMVSIALGTDTMGSVRLPAAYCGIVGFKPTWGHIPTQGVTPLSRALDHVGVLCKTVQDARHAYGLLANRRQALESIDRPDPWRLAVPADLDALALEEPVRLAFDTAVQIIQEAGYAVTAIDLGAYPFTRVRRAGLQLSEAELIHQLASVYPDNKAALPPMLAAMMDFISGKSAADLARALTLLMDARETLERAAAPFDAIVLPTGAHLSFPMTDTEPADSADLTAIANVLGAPAISLPLPAHNGSLPAGLQLIGKRHDDHDLLRLAQTLEAIV
ncbi:MAG: amidase [Burkholderiaceae bacterium]